MEAGKLRHRLEIQRIVSETPNEFGSPEPVWATIAERWGSVEPLAGRELWQAQQVRPDITHTVRMRPYEGLTTKDRLYFRGRILNIEAIKNVSERNHELELTCIEEV